MNELTEEERETLREASSILGRMKTEAKARASRENGKKGGRPRKINVDSKPIEGDK